MPRNELGFDWGDDNWFRNHPDFTIWLVGAVIILGILGLVALLVS